MICEVEISTQAPEKLFHFLSFLFDVEAKSLESKNISFSLDEITFTLIKSKKCSQNSFILGVDTIEELGDLQSKLEFFCYKEGISQIKTELTDKSLKFLDFENRAWTFKIK